MKVSVAIPCYDMNGKGDFFLDFNIEKIARQTHRDIEIVISDHSKTDIVKNVVDRWKTLNIKYVKFDKKYGNSSANTNNAIRNCTGDIIKILCQDDYLYDEFSVEKIVENFSPSNQWLVSAYVHTKDHVKLFKKKKPKYNDKIYIKNTIGTHSSLTIRNGLDVFFDEELIWFMDCEYYRRLYDNYGAPKILNEITMVQFLWEGQVTNTLADKERRLKEFDYLQTKYGLRKSILKRIFN